MTRIEESNEEFSKLREILKDVTSVELVDYTMAEVFNHIFHNVLISETAENYIGGEIQGASRSNWTYHIAFAIKRTARLMQLNCRFETMGRLDAAIETCEEKPRLVLLAEWEWDHHSIFGEGKELEKLWEGASDVPNANALLFTYCPMSEIYDFIKAVIEYWQKRAGIRKEDYPILYLNVATYTRDSSLEVIKGMDTIEVHAEAVKVWGDPILGRVPQL